MYKDIFIDASEAKWICRAWFMKKKLAATGAVLGTHITCAGDKEGQPKEEVRQLHGMPGIAEWHEMPWHMVT